MVSSRLATLKLTVEISPFAPQVEHESRKIEIYLTQYAADLRDDLRLPAGISLRVKVMPDLATVPVRLFLDDVPRRTRWWGMNLSADLELRDIASVLSYALYQTREELLTPQLSDCIARQWGVRDETAYQYGWTQQGFRDYLRLFIRRGFHIERGKELARAPGNQNAEEWDVICRFEQAIEQAPDLCLGPVLLLSPSAPAESDGRAKTIRSHVNWLREDLGAVTHVSDVAQFEPGLQQSEFRIRVNDVRLPAFSGPGPDEAIVQASQEDLDRLDVPARALVDPLRGELLAVKNTPKILQTLNAAKVAISPLDYTALFLGIAIRDHAGSFLAAPMTQFLLDRLKKEAEDLVALVRKRFNPGQDRTRSFRWKLTAILRGLLDEEVSIRDLRGILGNLLSLREVSDSRKKTWVLSSAKPADSVVVAEGKHIADLGLAELSMCARMGVPSLARRYLTSEDSRVSFLEPKMEQQLFAAAAQPMKEEEEDRLRLAVLNAILADARIYDRPIMVNQAIRRRLKDLLRVEFPELAVISLYEVLASGHPWQSYATIAEAETQNPEVSRNVTPA